MAQAQQAGGGGPPLCQCAWVTGVIWDERRQVTISPDNVASAVGRRGRPGVLGIRFRDRYLAQPDQALQHLGLTGAASPAWSSTLDTSHNQHKDGYI
jgi:hypothetical protein